MPAIPPVPPMGRDVLDWFWDLSASRAYADSTPQPLNFTELGHWQAVRGISLTQSDVDLIRALDQAYRAALSEEMRYSEERRREASDKDRARSDR